jgi:hypothetical protein
MLIFKDIFLSDSNGYISVIVWPRAIANNMVTDESELVPIEYCHFALCLVCPISRLTDPNYQQGSNPTAHMRKSIIVPFIF